MNNVASLFGVLIAGVVGVFAFIAIILFLYFLNVWIRALAARAPVSIVSLIGMKLRRVPVGLIVDNRITAVKAGIDLTTDPLEAHYLAGGNVEQVVLALIALVGLIAAGLYRHVRRARSVPAD